MPTKCAIRGRSFNGATAVMPWNRATARTGAQHEACFNGATAVMPWNLRDKFEACYVQTRLQWGHGSDAVESIMSGTIVSAFASLQWGHGSDAVESCRILLRHLNEQQASMGPRQ